MLKKPLGDTGHSFIAKLQELVTKNRKIHKMIEKARGTAFSRAQKSGASWDAADEERTGIPREFILGSEGVKRASCSIYAACTADRLDKILRGRCVPEEQDLVMIALDHGLKKAGRAEFIADGKAYIAHCEERHNGQPVPPPKRSYVEAEEARRVAPADHQTKTQAALAAIIANRAADKHVIQIRNAKNGHLKPPSISKLRVKFELGEETIALLNGKPPQNHGRARMFLNQLLIHLQATTDERKAAEAAIEADIKKANGEVVPVQPALTPAPGATVQR